MPSDDSTSTVLRRSKKSFKTDSGIRRSINGKRVSAAVLCIFCLACVSSLIKTGWDYAPCAGYRVPVFIGLHALDICVWWAFYDFLMEW